MRPKKRWRKVAYFFVGLGLAYVFGCYYLATKYVRPGIANKMPVPATFRDLADPNVWASANLVEGKAPKAVFILVHGYGGNQSNWSVAAEELAKRGNGVVIPALPGHDNLTSETSGFALKESHIVVKTAEWARSKIGKDGKIVLVGISMGGAASWLATEEGAPVDAIATEGTFARLEPTMRRWFDRKAPGASTYLAPVIWFARRMADVDPGKVNPVESAEKWRGKPALIIHGSDDELCPTNDAEALSKASGAELWTVKGASHAHCSDVDFKGYLDRVEKLAK